MKNLGHFMSFNTSKCSRLLVLCIKRLSRCSRSLYLTVSSVYCLLALSSSDKDTLSSRDFSSAATLYAAISWNQNKTHSGVKLKHLHVMFRKKLLTMWMTFSQNIFTTVIYHVQVESARIMQVQLLFLVFIYDLFPLNTMLLSAYAIAPYLKQQDIFPFPEP